MRRVSPRPAAWLAWLASTAVLAAACSSGPHSSDSAGASGSASAGPTSGTSATGGRNGATTGGGTSGTPGSPDYGQPQVSRSIQLSADGASLWVVNTESDSISEIDVAGRSLTAELLLGSQRPAVTDGGRFDPTFRPRAIALVDSLNKAYVAAQAANQIVVVDTQKRTVLTTIPVGAEPVAVVATADGKFVYAVSHEAATVSKIDTSSDAVVATIGVGEHPWGAALRADGSLLYVSQFLLNPGVTVIDTASFTVQHVTPLPDQPADPSANKLIPNGEVRGVYAVVPRPFTGELWVPHLLLAVGTAQPQLDFESTVFPTFTLLAPGGASIDTRLLLQSSSSAGTFAGAFGPDVISGPRDIAFTPDGALALVADAQSEDVLAFNADSQVQAGFVVRPLPSALIEGIVIDRTGTHAYLQGRNTHDVTVLAVDEAGAAAGGQPASVDGDPIECLAGADPMPATYRHGQRLFYSSNSAQFPITQNFWMACSSCHLEGQSDAVTWQFLEGPRDTPSNAGGPINTGFLFRQAVRNSVVDYDETIRIEQGGSYSRTETSQQADLQAIADFTNFAIPFPQNPNRLLDGGLTASQANGAVIFQNNCAQCHATPGVVPGSAEDFFTDSGKNNPTLNLGGNILLHNMSNYTCVASGPFPDKASTDIDGGPRAACNFDTPTLRGVFASAPYFHDGSAATVDDAVGVMLDVAGVSLSDSDRSDLTAYVMTL